MTAFNDSTDVLWLIGVQCAQISVLFLGVWCMCRWLLTDRPYLAHGLWVLLLIKCVTPPVWSSDVGVFSWMLYQPTERLPVEEPAEPMGTIVDDPRLIREMRERASAVPEGASATRTVSDHAENSGLNGESRDDHGPRVHWPLIILSIWVGGAIIIVTTTLGRFLLYRRRIWKAAIAHGAAWDEFLDALRKRLGVWRRVRLVVTREPVGPAVFGLIRPTIVLPEAVVANRSPSELEPILAHELIHVRRGDLWIGLLQLAVGALWWFHPLAWIAIRQTSRTSEECCDLAVVDALPHARRAYADLLLDVLAHKQLLRAVPLVPGMKPGDVTFRRMERIMTFNSKPSRGAVCLRWVVLLGVALVTLPGAGWDGAEEPDERTSGKIIVQEGEGGTVAEAKEAPSSEKPEYIVKRYHLGSVLYNRLKADGINKKGAQQLISQLFLKQRDYEFDLLKSDGTPEEGVYLFGDARRFAVKSSLRFEDDGAIVRATDQSHERFERLVTGLGLTGASQIEVEVTGIVVGTPELDEFIEWKTAGEYETSVITPTKKPTVQAVDRAEVKYAIIEPALWDAIKARGKVTESPKVTVFNGQTACLGDFTRQVVPTEPIPNWEHSVDWEESWEGSIDWYESWSGVFVWAKERIHGWQYEIRIDVRPTGKPEEDSLPLRIGEEHMETATLHLDSEFLFSHLDELDRAPYDADEKSRQPIGVPYIRKRIAKIDIPVPLGKVLVLRGTSLFGPMKGGKEHPVAFTIRHLPTEVWRRVGTDEFRIEPAE